MLGLQARREEASLFNCRNTRRTHKTPNRMLQWSAYVLLATSFSAPAAVVVVGVAGATLPALCLQ